MTTRLSVNVNKIAVLRNSRGGAVPDVVVAARTVVAAGAQGITVHPRPDLRHITPTDVARLADAELGVELNIEGNPFAPASGRYPGLFALVQRAMPAQVTLVPDSDSQLTSDHGFDLTADCGVLSEHIAAFQALGCRVSLFVDADTPALERAATLGADRIEIYTGPFAAAAAATGDARVALASIQRTAVRCAAAGLGINAGHDLDQHNLGRLKQVLGAALLEVSIGHALIAEALYAGLDQTVRRYRQILVECGAASES